MSLEALVTAYGYPALFVGTFFEGETVLVAAGYAAHRGYLSLPWVWVVAFLGSTIADQLWFFLGRSHGRAMIAARPSWQKKADRMNRYVDRHAIAMALAFRFIYGGRIVIPLVLAMGAIRPRTFAILNLIGAALWAVIVGTLGYFLGHALQLLMADVRKFEGLLIVGLLLLGLVIWAVSIFRRGKSGRAPNPTE